MTQIVYPLTQKLHVRKSGQIY